MIANNRALIALTAGSMTLFAFLAMPAAFPGTLQHRHKAPAKPSVAPATGGATGEVALGKKSYAAHSCDTCHSIDGKGGKAGPDLTQTGAEPTHTIAWLSEQVANPKSHTPDSTMPAFASSIKGKELTELATYLSSLKGAAAASPANPTPTAHAAPPSAAEASVMAQIEKMGGHAQQLAESDSHLDISFHMLGAAVTDNTLEMLKGLKKTVHLDLGQTAVTDMGLVKIEGLTGLTELHLEGTKITDKGLDDLKGMHDLEYLNLYGTQVTDAGLDHLAGLKNLRHLYVWQTKVTDAGVNKLKTALPQLEIVTGWDQAPKK